MVYSKRKHVIRILHVDDDPSALDISKQILMDMGTFDFDSASCVDEAFEKLATKRYDVVISDYQMPQKDGLEFLKELRKQDNEIPFILFTGKGREEVAIKALNLGADGYINKHGDPGAVYGALSRNIRITVERDRAREELQERDIRFKKLSSQTPGMLYQFLRRPDGTYCVPFTSDAIRIIFGCSPQDVVEDFSPIAKAILPEDLNKVISSIEQSAATMTPWQCEYRVKLPGQNVHWLWGQSVPERLADGSILWNGYNADITERKKTESALRQSEQQFKQFFSCMPSAVAIYNAVDNGADFVLKDFNSAAERIEKIDKAAVLGKRVTEAFPGVKDFGILKVFERVWKTGRKEDFPTAFYQDDRELGSWRENCVIKLPNNRIAAIYDDITERKKAEQQIKRSAEEWKKTFDAISDFVFIIDKENKFTGANKALCDFLNKEQKDLIGKRCCEVIHGANEILMDCPCAKSKVTRKPESIEKGDAHSSSWFLLSVWPFFDENGEYAGCVHTAKNITERKKADEKLKDLKAFDERIINSLDDALLVIDPDDYKIISSNEVALKQLNLKKEDLIGKTCYQTTHHSLTPCKAPEHDCPIRKVMETKETITVEHRHFDENNNELIVEVSARLVKDPEGKTVVIHVSRDITERKHMETAIREAEKRYRALFDQAPVGILNY